MQSRQLQRKKSCFAAFPLITLLVGGTAVCPGSAWSQEISPTSLQMNEAAREEVVEGILARIKSHYVFPNAAQKIVTAIHQKNRAKAYAACTTGEALTAALNRDLQELSHDKHLGVIYSARPVVEPEEANLTPAQRAQRDETMRQEGEAENWGFQKAEVLRGNVGYLDLRYFAPPDFAGETAAAAMNFLSHTDALIIDLRFNPGGHPAMVAFLCSYLLTPPSLHGGTAKVLLLEEYDHETNSTSQFWTLPYVPGRRYAQKPVYVLTGGGTFSAAEALGVVLQDNKRALVVGEVTGGGSHATTGYRVNPHFEVSIPFGTLKSGFTHKDWEGTGVKPDIATPARSALQAAYVLALEALRTKADSIDKKQELGQIITEVKKETSSTR